VTRLRWLAVLPSAGGLAVSLTALTAGAAPVAAQDAYSFHMSLPEGVSQRTQPVRRAEAKVTAKVDARREAAHKRRVAARRKAEREAQQQAALAQQRISPVTVTTTGAAPDCPLHALGDMGRVDEGVDYMGAGPVYALGSGTVTYTGGGDWPGGGFIAYHLDSGNYVYLAEDVTSQVSVGQRVHPGTVIGEAWGGGDGIETGWAMPPGTMPEAAAYNHYTDGVPTAEGYDFRSVLYSMGCH
jgi:murein DD-endopeptidase MepM/ murein hydrolase activator NlpD